MVGAAAGRRRSGPRGGHQVRHKFLVLEGGRAGEKPRRHMILEQEYHAPVRGLRNGMIAGVAGWGFVLILGAVAWRVFG
jgi:hypothetical protein